MEELSRGDGHRRERAEQQLCGAGHRPLSTKFVRVVMTRSSNTCDTHGSADRRNCVGYAIRELYLGTINEKGEFKDLLHHSPDQKQTLTLCSSVDPWHEPSDLYVAPDRMESGDQPGFDLFFTSGITRGLPAIVPVAMLYATPEDAAAQMTLHQEARLSGFVHRNGRGARRAIHAARGLRDAVFAVRDRAASGRPEFQTRAGRFSKESRRTSKCGPMRRAERRGWGDSSTI